MAKPRRWTIAAINLNNYAVEGPLVHPSEHEVGVVEASAYATLKQAIEKHKTEHEGGFSHEINSADEALWAALPGSTERD